MTKRTIADAGGKLAKQYRYGTIELAKRADGAAADTPDTYDLAISSEAEVQRWFGAEILSHDRAAVDMQRLKRGAAVLVDHYGDQVGVVTDARLDSDRVLRGSIRFSKSARGQEVEQDVRDGIRRNVSVGYFIHNMKLTEERNDGKDPVYTVTRWEPAEVSIVSVPADVSVGFGRSESPDEECPVIIEGGPATEEARNMLLNTRKLNAGGAGGGAAPVQADPAPGPSVTDIRTAEEKRATAIRETCGERFAAQAAGFIASDLSVEGVAARIMEAQRTTGKAQTAEEQIRTVAGRDLSNYSYMKAVRGAVAMAEGGKFDGLEAEVHAEMLRTMPDNYTGHGGVIVPTGKRTTMDSNTPAKGVEIVPEKFGAMIELLRPRARVIESGATVLTGLTGPVAFPKQTGGATVSWVPENPASNVADGEPSLGLALLQPKTLQGNIPFTRQLLAQASLDVEGWVRSEIAIGHGLAIDKAAVHGRGNNGEPTGIYIAPTVNSVDFGSSVANVTTANLLAMVSGIFDKNASDDTMGWLFTPLIAAVLRGSLEFSAAGSRTLWDGKLSDGTVLGYAARSTTQLSKVMSGSQPTGAASHAGVFGNWADLLVALFGALELVVDPYSLKKKAIIEVTSFQMADILVRHGESFSKAVNMTLT